MSVTPMPAPSFSPAPTTPLSDLARVQRLSAVCASGCAALAAAIPATVAALWALAPWSVLAMVRQLPPDVLDDMGPIQVWQRIAGAAISLIPALLVCYGLVRVRRALSAFAGGEFFATDVAAAVRDYARAMVWAALASILCVPILSVALTFANARGHRELSFDLSGAQLLNLMGAAIIWLVASAMTRAAGVARENEQFV